MRRSRLAPAFLVLALLAATPALPQRGRAAAPPRTASLGGALRGFLPNLLSRLLGYQGCGIDSYSGTCKHAANLQSAPRSVILAREGLLTAKTEAEFGTWLAQGAGAKR